jgi:hypothetical protein
VWLRECSDRGPGSGWIDGHGFVESQDMIISVKTTSFCSKLWMPYTLAFYGINATSDMYTRQIPAIATSCSEIVLTNQHYSTLKHRGNHTILRVW